jgi:hypothetical protein
LLPLSLVIVYWNKKEIFSLEKKYVLLLLFIIIVFGLIENIIMAQHAAAYHFDRLKLLPIFSLAIPIIWTYKNYSLRLFVILIIVGTSIYSLYQYPTSRIHENIALTQNKHFIEKSDFNKECSSCIVGISGPVRGYTNLLFGRAVHEFQTSKKLNNLSNQIGQCACFVITKGIAESMIQINSFVKYNPNVLPLSLFVVDTPFDLTDANWINGVGRNWAGFFVQNTKEARDLYKIGMAVQFADAQVRRIVDVKPYGTFLNIFVEGAPLDGRKVGYPNKVEITDRGSDK